MLDHPTTTPAQTFDRDVQIPVPRSFRRLILLVEGLLLGLAILGPFMPMPPLFMTPQASLSTLFCTIAFSLLGLRLTYARLHHRILYTALEFGLIFLPILLGDNNRALPFLIVILVIRSCQMFRLRECLAILALAFTLFSLAMIQESQKIGSLFQSLQTGQLDPTFFSPKRILLIQLSGSMSFGLMLLAATLLVTSLLSVHQSRQQLAIANNRLHQYALCIENQATLQERNRIAREIHDSLGHALTAQIIQLENAMIFCPQEAEKTLFFISQSRYLGSRALQEVRQSVATLRAFPATERPLQALIYAAVQEFKQVSEIDVICSTANIRNLSPEINIMVYRILQEALINVQKHSAATEVQIDAQRTTQHLVISVRDNGQGFNPQQNQTGFGLQGMKERAAAFNGQLRLISQPGSGCKVIILIPLGNEIQNELQQSASG